MLSSFPLWIMLAECSCVSHGMSLVVWVLWDLVPCTQAWLMAAQGHFSTSLYSLLMVKIAPFANLRQSKHIEPPSLQDNTPLWGSLGLFGNLSSNGCWACALYSPELHTCQKKTALFCFDLPTSMPSHWSHSGPGSVRPTPHQPAF